MTPKRAVAFVRQHGIVLQAARGPVPNLAEQIAGEPIKGSWWAHPKAYEIFRVIQIVCDDPDVLVCKFVDGKVTYVHRRVWPALVKLASRFPKKSLAQVRDEHTETGAHRSRSIPFPEWVPAEVFEQAEHLSVEQAESMLRVM